MDFLGRASTGGGGARAIVELRRRVHDVAVASGHLDADVAGRRRHDHRLARQAFAGCLAVAHADGGGFAEQRRRHGLARRGRRDHRHQRAGPALLHVDRRVERIHRALGQQAFEQPAEELRVHVVDLGLDDHHLVAWLDGLGFADHHPRHVGRIGKVARARTIPDPIDAHRRHRAEGRGVAGDQERSGRRDQLRALLAAIHRDVAQQAQGRRRRHRVGPVRGGDRTAADVQRRRHHPLRAHLFEGVHRAHDVDDRIQRADLVQVHLLHRCAVHGCFGFAEAIKEADRPVLARPAQRRPFNQARNLVQRPMGRIGRSPVIVAVPMPACVVMVRTRPVLATDAELGRCQARARDPLGPHGVMVDGQAAQRAANVLERYTGVDQRAQQHVSGHTGEAIDVQHLHNRSILLWAAAHGRGASPPASATEK